MFIFQIFSCGPVDAACDFLVRRIGLLTVEGSKKVNDCGSRNLETSGLFPVLGSGAKALVSGDLACVLAMRGLTLP
jgi:hypothetical protein